MANFFNKITPDYLYCYGLDAKPIYDNVNPSTGSRDPLTKINISPGRCAPLQLNTHIVSDEDIIVDLNKTGINGLDVGNPEFEEWYHLHVIADSTNRNSPKGILTKKKNSPYLPTGYDTFRFIMSIKTLSEAAYGDYPIFYDFSTIGNGTTRTFQYLNTFNAEFHSNDGTIISEIVDVDYVLPPDILNSSLTINIDVLSTTDSHNVMFIPPSSSSGMSQAGPSLTIEVADQSKESQLHVHCVDFDGKPSLKYIATPPFSGSFSMKLFAFTYEI